MDSPGQGRFRFIKGKNGIAMHGKTFALSGVSLGQRLTFHGIRQRTQFAAHIAPNYRSVFSAAREMHAYRTAVVLYDQTVPNVQRFIEMLTPLIGVPMIQKPLLPGESLKTLPRVAQLTDELGTQDIGEKSLMLVIGGGTVCNAAGFLAAMWQGMQQIVIPTNYTAIADVAIGSLHMLNVGEIKNRLQLYADPLAVVFDPQFFTTLPDAERRNGLAETAKHAVAQESALFTHLEARLADGTILHDDPLFDIALHTAQLKDTLMARDPFGEYAQSILLYGHTIAHAIEPASQYTIPHGAAVSMGILAELAFFHGPETPLFRRTKALLEGIGLPVQLPHGLSVVDVLHHLDHAMTGDGRLFVPRVAAFGQLEEKAGRYVEGFDRRAVERALATIC